MTDITLLTAALVVVAIVSVVVVIVRGIMEADERRDARRRNQPTRRP